MKAMDYDVQGLKKNNNDVNISLAKTLTDKVRKDQAARESQNRANVEQAKLNNITAQELEKDIQELETELPGLGQITFAVMVALAADILGFLRIAGSLWMGPIIDGIALALINFSMGFKPLTLWGSILEGAFDFLPPIGTYVSMIPIHTGAIGYYYYKHKKEYAELWKLKGQEVELGIRSSSFMNLGNNSIISSLIVFVVILAVFILPILSVAGVDNGPGNAIVSAVPFLQGLKDSGRVENLVDYGDVAAEEALAGFDPIATFMNFWNGTLYNLGGGNSFTTKVEKNQDGDLGLEIKEFDVFNYNTVDDDLSFSYFITGKTFIEDQSIVKNSCRLQKGEKIISGIPSPEDFYLVKDFTTNEIVFCEIPIKHEKLDPGSYRLIANSTYSFEVWSYIPYTFMSIDNLRAQGDSVNENLDIDKKTKSLSTNGPIIIAIAELGQNIPQPYPVRTDEDTNFAFSFQLQNKENGKLKKLERVILQVPEGIVVDKCSDFAYRDDAVEDQARIKQILEDESDVDAESLEGYNLIMFHTFKDQVYDENYNKDIDFRCRFIIEEDGGFLKSGPKTIATVVVSAKYVYEIEESKIIRLEEALTVQDNKDDDSSDGGPVQ